MKIKELGDNTLITFLEKKGFNLEDDINAIKDGWTPLLRILEDNKYSQDEKTIVKMIAFGADPKIFRSTKFSISSGINLLIENINPDDLESRRKISANVKILFDHGCRFSDNEINDFCNAELYNDPLFAELFLPYIDGITAERTFKELLKQERSSQKGLNFINNFGAKIINKLINEGDSESIRKIMEHISSFLGVEVNGLMFSGGITPIMIPLMHQNREIFLHYLDSDPNHKMLRGLKDKLITTHPDKLSDNAWVAAIALAPLSEDHLNILLQNNYDQLSLRYISPLGAAVQGGQIENIMRLTRNNIHEVDSMGVNAGIWAVRFSKTEKNFDLVSVLKKLIQNGFDINAWDLYGNTLLTFAILDSPPKQTNANIKMLVDLGINVNQKNKEGNPPLILAIRKGDVGILRTLLSVPELDLFSEDAYHNLPLEIALETENKEIIDFVKQETHNKVWKKINDLISENKLSEVKNILKKVFKKEIPKEDEWKTSAENKKILSQFFSELQGEPLLDFESNLTTLRTLMASNEPYKWKDEPDLIKNIVNNDSECKSFEDYLLKNDSEIYHKFMNAKVYITIRECVNLYNEEKNSKAIQLLKKRNLDFEDILKTIIDRFDPVNAVIKLFAQYQFGDHWSLPLYQFLKTNPTLMTVLEKSKMDFTNDDKNNFFYFT